MKRPAVLLLTPADARLKRLRLFGLLFGVLFLSTSHETKETPLSTEVADGSNVIELPGTFGRLPMTFEANQGQHEAAVKYVTRGPGYSLGG